MAEWRRYALAAAGYVALALLLVRSLFGRFSTAIAHDAGDPLLSAWILWWNSRHVPFVGSWWDGLAFFPLRGSLAFSDHRVGLELIAGPVLWLGGTPVLAYNVTFVSCFVLSALAAHALTRTLTGSHAAGAVSGIVFGFNPYRMAHLAHLELQAAFCLPLALLALHRYLATSRRRWLVAFSFLLVLQGLCSGYYLFFSIPLVGLGILWFPRNAPLSRRAALIGAWAVAFLVLLPVLLQYRTIHSQVGFGRGFGEMRDFSADLTGVLSAQPMKLWRLPSMAINPEAEVYIGVFAPLLILGAIGWRRSSIVPVQPRIWRLLRLSLTVVAVVFALTALSTLWGAWTYRLGPLKVSADGPDKPLTVVFAACVVLVLTSRAWAVVWNERSTFAFYVTSAVVAWLFALGPAPHFLNRPMLYRGPYALLMLLPGFADGFRAPARFMMISALAVAVAAGLAFVRVTASGSRIVRLAAAVAAIALLAVDSWPAALPAAALPAPMMTPPDGRAVVLELPLGDVFDDIAAVYRSIFHGRRVVNGYSGYDPPAYQVLRLSLERRDESVVPVLASFAPVLVRVDRTSSNSASWEDFIRRVGAADAGSSSRERLFLLPQEPLAHFDPGAALPIRSVRAMPSGAVVPLTALPDGTVQAGWRSAGPQRSGDELMIELDRPHTVAEVDLVTGSDEREFPGAVLIETSVDGREWVQQWRSGSGGVAFLAAMEAPNHPVLRFRIGAIDARLIRIRQLWNDTSQRWSISSLAVRDGTPGPIRQQ
jgi:hypothetical protein